MNITKIFKDYIDEHPKSILQRPLRLLREIKRNPFKQFRIKKIQDNLFKRNYSRDIKKIILFISPSDDMVNGGILSINGHYEETQKLKGIHGAEVLLCSGPNEKLLLKYTKFKNNNYIFSFKGILTYFKELEIIMIHIPEYMTDKFVKEIEITKDYYLKLKRIKDVHINIMLQHIGGLKYMTLIKELKQYGMVTCTTAHKRYSTLELREKLNIPLHYLTPRGDASKFYRAKYNEKDELMIISPDEHPLKSKVLHLINDRLPHIRLQIISNLTFEEYKKVIEKAKWALTFGEGLDGYFLQTIFSGGISYSVYNTEFFTEEFRPFKTVYENYDLLLENICADIKSLDNESEYNSYQKKQYELCTKLYNTEHYYNNLNLFYKGLYTFP